MSTSTLSAAFSTALKVSGIDATAAACLEPLAQSSEEILLSVLRGSVTRADQIVARRATLRAVAWEIAA